MLLIDGKKVALEMRTALHKLIAKATAKIEPNPHFSHLGEVNCQECHVGAKAKPELMCNSCHNFTLREKAAKK